MGSPFNFNSQNLSTRGCQIEMKQKLKLDDQLSRQEPGTVSQGT